MLNAVRSADNALLYLEAKENGALYLFSHHDEIISGKIPALALAILAAPAMAAGAVFIGVQVGHPHLDADSVVTTEMAVRGSLKVVMAALALVGITGMYLRQVRQTGVLGLIGYSIFAAGYLLILSTAFVAAYVLPGIAETDPAYVNEVIAAAINRKKTPHLRFAVLPERALLADADVFAFVYPLWFNGPPAILKGYVDRVFGMGFGFTPAFGGTDPALRGRRLISFTTSGAPDAWVQDTGAMDALRRLFDDHLAGVCGLEVVDHVHFGGMVSGITDEAFDDEVQQTVPEHGTPIVVMGHTHVPSVTPLAVRSTMKSAYPMAGAASSVPVTEARLK